MVNLYLKILIKLPTFSYFCDTHLTPSLPILPMHTQYSKEFQNKNKNICKQEYHIVNLHKIYSILYIVFVANKGDVYSGGLHYFSGVH